LVQAVVQRCIKERKKKRSLGKGERRKGRWAKLAPISMEKVAERGLASERGDLRNSKPTIPYLKKK